jgi:hypothetical protein
MSRILLTHSPDALATFPCANDIRNVDVTAASKAGVGRELKGRALKGAVNAEHWTRKALLR